MRQLTDSEKRTIRIAAVVIGVYLGLFYGLRGWNSIEAVRLEYRELLVEAQRASRDLRAHENSVLLLEKLKSRLRLDPAVLTRNTVVAEASAAMQKAAQADRIELGPIREGPGSQSSGELATMQVEATGEVAAVLTLLYRIETLGFPLVIDSVQIAPDSRTPGSIKVNLQIVILDFDRWTAMQKGRNA